MAVKCNRLFIVTKWKKSAEWLYFRNQIAHPQSALEKIGIQRWNIDEQQHRKTGPELEFRKLPALVTKRSKSTGFQAPTFLRIRRRRCAAHLIHAILGTHFSQIQFSKSRFSFKTPNPKLITIKTLKTQLFLTQIKQIQTKSINPHISNHKKNRHYSMSRTEIPQVIADKNRIFPLTSFKSNQFNVRMRTSSSKNKIHLPNCR